LKSRYGFSLFERVMPDKALAAMGLSLQGTYHLLNGRPEALRYIRS
jgi:hypothetical protein